MVWKRHLLILEGPFLTTPICVPPPPIPGRLGSHKVGWCLRIMAAEGEGSRQLANAAPICFHERGEEISEDETRTRTTHSVVKRERLKK